MTEPIQYDTKQKQMVHQLMASVLQGQALDQFIDTYFPPVAKHTTSNMDSNTKIRYVIEYAAQKGQLGKLVGFVQQAQPEAYQDFVQGVKTPQESEPAPPPEPAPPVEEIPAPVEPKVIDQIVPIVTTEEQILAQAQDLLKQTLADRYRITDVLDTSGRGAVFKALDTKSDLYVAIKVIDLDHLPVAMQERIRQDTRLAMKLDHPGIVQVIDFGQVDQLFYIIMEFIPGASLQQVRQSFTALEKKTVLPQLIQLMHQLSLTVDYMHHQEILHPSVMPDNIMLKPNTEGEGLAWQPVLINFALLRPHRETLAAQEEISVERLTYQVSPELLMGHATDMRSDVYALGILLYDLIVEQPPFRPNNIQEAIRLHIQTPPAPPHAINPDIPEDVDQVVLKALAKDPADRYLTAKGLAQALAECLEATSLPAPPPPPPADVIIDMDTSQPLVVSPGSTLTKTITLQNEGGKNDHCQVRVQGIPANWVSVTPLTTTLTPGETQQVKINISPPLSSLSRAGTYSLVIQVISQQELGQSNDIQQVLTVGPYSKFKCSLWPQELEDEQVSQLTIENEGNRTETFTIRPQLDDELAFEPEQEQRQIGPGEIEKVDFKVAPAKKPFVANAKQVTFSFQINSSEGTTDTISGQLTYRGVIALQWLLAGILVVSLFCCALIAILPAIRESLYPTPTPIPTITPLPTIASAPVQPAPVPTVAPPMDTPTPVPTVAPPTVTPLPTVPAVTSIPVVSPTPQTPIAVISGPNRALVGQSVTFDGSGSQAGSSAITTYNWDFGDSTQASGVTVSHLYQNVGYYQVTLTVIDGQGQSNSTRLGIQITDQ